MKINGQYDSYNDFMLFKRLKKLNRRYKFYNKKRIKWPYLLWYQLNQYTNWLNKIGLANICDTVIIWVYRCNKQNKQWFPVFTYNWKDDGCNVRIYLIFESGVWKSRYKTMYKNDQYDNNFTSAVSKMTRMQ